MTTKQKSKTTARKSVAKARNPKTAHKKTRTAKLVWRDVTCRVRHTPNYLSTGWSHIEITVVSPKKAPLPITETGYRSHFLDEELLKKVGGPVTFFVDWIEREAATKAWAKTDFKWRQGDLFQAVQQRRR